MAQRREGGLGIGLWALLLGLGTVFVVLLVLGGAYVQSRLSTLPPEDRPGQMDVLESLRGPRFTRTEW